MNAPAKFSAAENPLMPGTPDEIKVALGALIKTFPCGPQESPDDKIAGYLETLQGEPAWAVAAGVRKFIHGKVEAHDGRFLPTSAQVGKVVRDETEWHRSRQAAAKRAAETQKAITRRPLTPAQLERRRLQVQRILTGGLGDGPTHDQVMFADAPKCRVRRRWPDGTILEAKTATIIHPNGKKISYADWWADKQAKHAAS